MRMIKVGDCREYNDERERAPQLLQVSRFLFDITMYTVKYTRYSNGESLQR